MNIASLKEDQTKHKGKIWVWIPFHHCRFYGHGLYL